MMSSHSLLKANWFGRQRETTALCTSDAVWGERRIEYLLRLMRVCRFDALIYIGCILLFIFLLFCYDFECFVCINVYWRRCLCLSFDLCVYVCLSVCLCVFVCVCLCVSVMFSLLLSSCGSYWFDCWSGFLSCGGSFSVSYPVLMLRSLLYP